ncbi:MAG: glycosyltransferase [Betaproteobacteria bacterium]|nr:glycosyltransferase [Betaproteobacteria bacterium]
MDAPEALFARPIDGLLPVRDARDAIRVLVASLAPGGAERIVLEWLGAECARGRPVELAVLHARRTALAAPAAASLRVRGRESPEEFLRALARDWRDAESPVSAHLVPDRLLAILWEKGVRTVPVVHNARAGWRNDPASWDPAHVPLAAACAEAVRAEVLQAGCRVPVVSLRHRPRVAAAATDESARRAIRESLGLADTTFLVGVVGAFKPQKDHARALEVLAALAKRRDAALVVLGGLLDRGALAELDRLLEAAVRLGVADRLRLPGFVTPVEPWLAAMDALLNVSRFEGLSIAVQEALAAGLPVVAADVGGQREIDHPALELLPPGAGADAFAKRLARHPVRTRLEPRPFARAPRAWSLTLAHRRPSGPAIATLLVTANLNAGGAQRSLVNLARSLAGRHAIAVAVCGVSTQGAFAAGLRERGVEAFRVAATPDDLAIAESLLAHASARRARALCFWNVAPGVKLAVSRFAPPGLRLVDASPGRYAFEELEGATTMAAATGQDAAAYYRRLDTLVIKHADPAPPRCARVEIVPNGVGLREPAPPPPRSPRFLVSGRLAPSKRLETVLAAFEALVRERPGAELHVVGTAAPRHAAHAHALREAGGAGVRFRGPDAGLGYLAEPWTAAIVLGTHQGSPNAVLEAMSAGIAVIANASGGTGEIVRDGVTGWLLPEACRAEDLARAMGEAAADGPLARRLGLAGRERVARRHSLESMALRYLSIFETGSVAAPVPQPCVTAIDDLPRLRTA